MRPPAGSIFPDPPPPVEPAPAPGKVIAEPIDTRTTPPQLPASSEALGILNVACLLTTAVPAYV
jgi:hypothetical protein